MSLTSLSGLPGLPGICGVGIPPDTDAPTLQSATTQTTGLTTVLVFSEAVTGVQAGDFALSTGQAISGVSGSGTTWTLTHAQVYQGTSPTLSYSGTSVKDAANNALATFSGRAITNNSTVSAAGTLSVNLLHFYELEEASGTRQDSHGTNHLSDINTVTQGAGVVGNCASFAAASLERLAGTQVDMRSTSFYVCAWVKVTGAFAAMVVLHQGGVSVTEQWALKIPATGKPDFFVRDGSTAIQVSSSVSLTLNTWAFLEAWYDLPAKRGWLNINNGTPVSTLNASMATLATPSGGFQIGSTGTGSYFNGLIDQPGIWTRIPTSAERTYLYNSGNGRSYASVSTASP